MFGLSPYTLLVEVKINFALGQYFFVNSNKFNVPFALTVKSVCGSFVAQSWDGWAAACITQTIFMIAFFY